MSYGALFQYFDRIEIIHLPSRVDRLHDLRKELMRLGLDIESQKVCIPVAPMPESANGFPSRGVYGNFLSHLDILTRAYADNLESVLILEDDAIFSSQFNQRQEKIADLLSRREWDAFFIGHSVTSGLPDSPTGIAQFRGDFYWAHCYAIHRRLMKRLIDCLAKTIEREVGHPEGGKMYIDGALNMFRKQNPELVCLISSPCLSIQKGSPSSLNRGHWYDRQQFFRRMTSAARIVRDEAWRRGLMNIKPKGSGRTQIQYVSSWPK